MLVADVEGHTVLHAVNEVSAFGVERHHEVVLLLAGQACLRALIHAAGVVVASFVGLTVDGQHAAVETVPHAVVVGCHLAVVEAPGLVAAVVVLAHVEVEHPAGIGAQLVVAGVERVGQCELAAGVSLWADHDGLALHQQTVGREQLHVEQAAHVRGLQVVGPHHVSLVPQGIAHEVALVIGMQIDLFLYLRH